MRLGSWCCPSCKRYLPKWMYMKARKFKTVTGRVYNCRLCVLRNNQRWTKEQTAMGLKCKTLPMPTLWERIKEALTP